jgi:hypothetical protein
VAGQGGSASAVEYKAPITLARSAAVRARVLSSGTWSALNEAVYAVGPVTAGPKFIDTASSKGVADD